MSDLQHFKAAMNKIKDGMTMLSNGPLEYHIAEMIAAHELLMTRFCPFKVGDRVRLAKAPVITDKIAFGWLSAKHFLIKGAEGIVRDASCGSRGFRFGTEFDDESWVDRDGVVRAVDRKHTYSLGESDLAPAGDSAMPPKAGTL